MIIHILITENVLARTPFLSLATPLGAAIELNKLSRLKDEFLANTSHELRTSLNGILGIAAVAINDKAKYNLQLIASCACRPSTSAK